MHLKCHADRVPYQFWTLLNLLPAKSLADADQAKPIVCVIRSWRNHNHCQAHHSAKENRRLR
jgi:hypothetical protein